MDESGRVRHTKGMTGRMKGYSFGTTWVNRNPPTTSRWRGWAALLDENKKMIDVLTVRLHKQFGF
jgi:hypothetical protein